MGRRKNRKEKQTQPKEDKKVEVIVPASTLVKVNANDFPINKWSLDAMHNFLKSDERVFAVAYRVLTAYISDETMILRYKTEAMKALQDIALKRGLVPRPDKIEFRVLPLGEESIIKASVKLTDATGKGAIVKENIPMPKAGKEGLFVEEK